MVDHSTHDVADELLRITGGRGVDVIVDPVQGEQGAALRQALRVGGRHVLCGHAGGLIPHDPDFYLHNHTLIGVDLGGYPRDEMQRMHAEAQAAIDLFEKLDRLSFVTRLARVVDRDDHLDLDRHDVAIGVDPAGPPESFTEDAHALIPVEAVDRR